MNTTLETPNQVSLQHGQLYNQMTYIAAVTKADDRLFFGLTKDTPDLTLSGELWVPFVNIWQV